METKYSKNFWQTEGTYLAAIPFFGYLVGLAFEAGYCSYFDIPIRFIELDFVQIAIASLVAAFYLVLIFIYFQWMVTFVQMKHPAGRAIGRILLMGLPLLILIIATNGHWVTWLGFGGMLMLGAIGYLLLPFLSRKKEEGYWERVASEVNKDLAIPPNNSEKNKAHKTLDAIEAIIGVAFMTLFLFWGIGRTWAESEQSFLVINSEENTVLLRKYGDYLITKKFDRETKTISKGITIIKLQDNTQISLASEIVGPFTKP